MRLRVPRIAPRMRHALQVIGAVGAVMTLACVDAAVGPYRTSAASSVHSDSAPPDSQPPDSTPPDSVPNDSTPDDTLPRDTTFVGLIHGQVLVVDSSQVPPILRPVGGARVTAALELGDSLARLGEGQPITRTDEAGYYRITSLARGTYEVRVVPRPGMAPLVRPGVAAGAGDSAGTPFTSFLIARTR